MSRGGRKAKKEPAQKNYYVPFQALGSVVVRATSPREAVERANERFGERELVAAGAFEDLTFNHKWGPGVEETTSPETPVPPPPPDPVNPDEPREMTPTEPATPNPGA